MPAIQPIDLPALFGIVFGTMIFLVPIAGFTLRFALRPFVEAYTTMRAAQATPDVERLARRVQELEQHVELLEARLQQPAALKEGLALPRGLRVEG